MDMYQWTRHAQWKMREYGLSEQRLKRVIRHPDRIEKSIVPKMVAAMQVAGTSKHRYEIWVMYSVCAAQTELKKTCDLRKDGAFTKNKQYTQKNPSPAARFRMERRKELEVKMNTGGLGEKTLRVISAWRYPGTSPKRDPIPEEILEEIRNLVR